MTEHQNDFHNIVAEVPGVQILREPKDLIENEQPTFIDENKIDASTEDTFAPVIKVTKHEAVFTKGDLKLQRVTVKEDISNGLSSHHDLLVEEVPSIQPLRMPKLEEKDTGSNGISEDRARTRIPTRRFRQAVKKLKDRRDSAENDSQVTANQKRRTSIPKLIRRNKNIEEFTPALPTTTPPEIKQELPIVDEFEKIYDEIINNEPIDLDETKLDDIISDIKDPEEKFEEVVHAYEEDELQPVITLLPINNLQPDIKLQPNIEKPNIDNPNTEKLNIERPKSKIPLKKRNSINEIKVQNQRPLLIKSASVDSKNERNTTGKDSKNGGEKFNKVFNNKDVEKENGDDIASYKVVKIIESEPSFKRSSSNIAIIENFSYNGDDVDVQDEQTLDSSKHEVIDNSSDKVDHNEPLRGKVSRLISKIDSNEYVYNDKKRKDEPFRELKKTSVLKKIALFEEVSSKDQTRPKTPPPTPILCPQAKFSSQTSYERRRPIIVEEIYKQETVENNDFEENTSPNNIINAEVDEEHRITDISEANNFNVQADLKEEYINNDKEKEVKVLNEEVQTSVYSENTNSRLEVRTESSPEDSELRLHRLISRQDERLKKASSITDLARNENHDDVQNISIEEDVEKVEAYTRAQPRKLSVFEKIALFEKKQSTPSIRSYRATPVRKLIDIKPKISSQLSRSDHTKSTSSLTKSISSLNIVEKKATMSEEDSAARIKELKSSKIKYGVFKDMKYIELNNGKMMPVIALGTALLDTALTHHIITTAVDLGYRAFDTAYVYGNEKAVGEAINAKISDGTVHREDLFIINKLWSTFHRTDLVEPACRSSLDAMGLDYFDLYLIHNPMSFKEGSNPIPKIANVIQFSSHDFLDAWFGMERLVSKGLARSIGVSNFNSAQIARVVEKGRVKPVVNQVESHPYLNQVRLADACLVHDIVISSYGCLGSVGSEDLRAPVPAVIQDPVVKLAAAGLEVTPAQLLIRYQLEMGRSVVTKASSAAHLWDNLLALTVPVQAGDLAGLNALNNNKRMFTFKGMGDTHRNYPFNVPF